VGRLDAQEVSDRSSFTSALKAPKPSDECSKEILRESAKLNPEDPRADLWKNV
jgi:hypothetical protein